MTVKPISGILETWSVYDGPVRVAVVNVLRDSAGIASIDVLKGECDEAKALAAIEEYEGSKVKLKGGIE